MTDQITPRRIEWQGPEGFTVILDEDGVHLRTPGAHGLEWCDLNRLLDVIAEAMRVRDAETSPVPAVPTRQQGTYYPDSYVHRRAERAIRAALAAEFNPSPSDDAVVPF